MGELQVNTLSLSDWKVYSNENELIFNYDNNIENTGKLKFNENHSFDFYDGVPSETIKSNYSILFNRVFFHFESIIYNQDNGYTIKCQLPIDANANHVGNVIIENPFNTAFNSTMANAEIKNNLLVIQSHLFNKDYAYVVRVKADISYEKKN